MLSTDQLNRFRARLEQQRAALQGEMDDVQRQLAAPEPVDDVSDAGDEGNLLFAQEQALNEQARLAQALDAVERALQRIADGSYGVSEVSGKPIPLERLEALPTATTLVDEPAPA